MFNPITPTRAFGTAAFGGSMPCADRARLSGIKFSGINGPVRTAEVTTSYPGMTVCLHT